MKITADVRGAVAEQGPGLSLIRTPDQRLRVFVSTIEQAEALLPGGEYAAQLAAGRSQTIDEALAAATPILQDRSPAATR